MASRMAPGGTDIAQQKVGTYRSICYCSSLVLPWAVASLGARRVGGSTETPMGLSMSNGFSVNYPALASIRQALQDCADNLNLTVQRTGPGCTAAAEAYPAWSTSAAVSKLHAAHSTRASDYADAHASHAGSVQACMDNYSQAEATITGQTMAGFQTTGIQV